MSNLDAFGGPGAPVGQQNPNAGSQNQNSKAPSKTLANKVGSETIGVGASILKNGVKQTIENIASGGVGGIMSAIRGFGIPIDGLSGIFGGGSTASWSRDDTGDWRMRLSIPVGMSLDGVLQAQLNETQGMIFPYTPSIIFQHSAQYSMMKPTHSNYPFPIYQSSQPDALQISGEFSGRCRSFTNGNDLPATIVMNELNSNPTKYINPLKS